jgi:hypothetical protein
VSIAAYTDCGRDKKTHHRGTEDTEKGGKPESWKAGKLEDEKVRI